MGFALSNQESFRSGGYAAAKAEKTTNKKLAVPKIKTDQEIIVEELDRICRHFAIPVGRIRKSVKALLEKDFDEAAFQATVSQPISARAAITGNSHSAPLWKERSGNDKYLPPHLFIKKYYKLEIQQHILTQAYIRQCDRSLYQAFHNWRHREKKKNPSIDIVRLIGFDFPASLGSRAEKYEERYGEEGPSLLEAQRKIDRARMKAQRRQQKQKLAARTALVV